jgi:predicted ATPase
LKIKSISLKSFKRFTELRIQNIPETAKLIVMAGPNGCGKSSIFDALKSWHAHWKGAGASWDARYHHKYGIKEILDVNRAIKVDFHGTVPTDAEMKKKALYVRTAYRNDPQFRLKRLDRMTSPLDEERFDKLIQNDIAVSSNYQRLVSKAFRELFVTHEESTTIGEFRQQVIGDIKSSLQRVFPDLVLNDLGDPLDEGTFFFDKGVSQKFEYPNLSGGEKAAFDIILDLVVKCRDFNDTVFCIDEPDLHMNTRLQGDLLQEMYDLINDNSQIWIATHSIGMMRKAKDLAVQRPGSVTFLDFDNMDFDKPQVIEPAKTNRAFWENVFKVALDDLAELVTPKQIVICEGVPRGTAFGPNVAHDAECLDRIFSDEFPDTKFLAGGNCHEVINDRHALTGAIEALSRGASVISIIDRDDRSSDDILDLQKEGIRVMSRRHLESYLFDDEVLDALCDSVGRPDKIPEMRAAKNQALQNSISRNNAADDIKSAAGQIYDEAKRILVLTGVGNDPKAFMRSTLAPLITRGTTIYEALKEDIFKLPSNKDLNKP